jgi:hypothetical protein
MRRFYRCGAAVLALLLAVGVTFVYARCHPDSKLTRGVRLAYDLSVKYNPLTPVARLAADRAAPAVEGVAEAVLPDVPAAQNDTPATDSGDTPVQESSPVPCPAVAAAVTDFLRGQAEMLSVDEEQGCCEDKGGKETVHKLCPATEEAGGAEEAEDHMPLTGDSQGAEPADMPYSKDDTGWWSHVMSFLKSAGKKGKPAVAGEEVPDGSATVHPGAPVKCQEDSGYPFQDSACPYPGACACPEHKDKPAAVPETEGGAEEQSMPPHKPARHKSARPVSDEGCEECPPHPEVDTMEFRPSDAHPGEFDQQPM